MTVVPDSSSARSRLLREPFFLFLVVGAVAAAMYFVWAQAREDREDQVIEVSAAEIQQLQIQWEARWNRPPTSDELDGVIQAWVRETALHREAVAMGLDKDDLMVRRVLAQKLERMINAIVESSLQAQPSDLETYFAANIDRYRPPTTLTFSQVFLDPDRRGDQTLVDADRILEQLRSTQYSPGYAQDLGDAFMLQSYYPEKDEPAVAKLFGREFAQSVFELTEGEWHGPVLSGYGTHLVYVEARRETEPPSLADIIDRVTQDWRDDQRREMTERYLDEIVGKYEVRVDREPGADGVPVTSSTLP